MLLHLCPLNALLDVLVRVLLGQPKHFLINVCLSLGVVGTGDYVHLNSIHLLFDGLQLEYGLMIDLNMWQLSPVEDSLYGSRQGWWHHLVMIDLDLDLRDPHDLCIPTYVGTRLMLQVIIALCVTFLTQVQVVNAQWVQAVLTPSHLEIALIQILALDGSQLGVRLQDHSLLIVVIFYRESIELLLGTIRPHKTGIINHPLIRLIINNYNSMKAGSQQGVSFAFEGSVH